MKLPELRVVLVSVGEQQKLSEKSDGTKRTIVFKIPERKMSDEWGEEKTIREEVYEADVINKKVPDNLLFSMVGQRVHAICYLNGFEYKKKDNAGKETGEIGFGKSITLTMIKKAEGVAAKPKAGNAPNTSETAQGENDTPAIGVDDEHPFDN